MRAVLVASLFIFFWNSCLALHPNFKNRSEGKNDFDVYLDDLDSREGNWITKLDEEKEIESSGDVEISDFKLLPSPSTKKKDKYKLKRQICCKLGRLAGDKGYLCYANFYYERIMERNRNRAQSKMRTGIDEKIKKSKDKLMRTFSMCFKGMKDAFNKCCYQAWMNR